MSKYKRTTTGYYKQRETYLASAGFEAWEIRELVYGAHYTTFRRNPALGSSDPALYLQKMITWRRLYVGNLKRAGYSPAQIHQRILDLYQKQDWMSHPENLAVPGTRRDPLKMLRSFRKRAIASGDYTRPKKKGSHHALKRGDIQKQGARRDKALQEQVKNLNWQIQHESNLERKTELAERRNRVRKQLG